MQDRTYNEQLNDTISSIRAYGDIQLTLLFIKLLDLEKERCKDMAFKGTPDKLIHIQGQGAAYDRLKDILTNKAGRKS
jgi:hypothetical protein